MSALFSFLIFTPAKLIGQKSKEFKPVSESANQFIEIFHKTLDFGIAFDKMYVSDAIPKMRKSHYFQSIELNSELEATADDAVLEEYYKVFMNYYYLNGLCNIGDEADTIPPEVAEFIKSTKFAKIILNENSDDKVITTVEEIKQFTTELNNIVDLYRKCIPKDTFKSKKYKTMLKKLTIKQSPNLEILDGYEDFGIKKGAKVYLLERDLFIFYFVKENGKFKILTLGIGN